MSRLAAVCTFVLSAALVPAQANLRINEVATGNTDWAEIINLGPDIAYIGGYKVYWGCSTSPTTWTTGSYTAPAGAVLYVGQSLVVTDSPTAVSPVTPAGSYTVYWTSNPPWSTLPAGLPTANQNGIVTLVNAANVGVDRVQWGAVNATNAASISFGAVWTGGNVVATNQNLIRINNNDTDAAADWGSTGTATPSAPNAGQSVIIGATMSLTTAGGGELTMTISTTPPLAGREVFNLLSLVDLSPNGSGPIFGLATDVINEIVTPISPFNPFHTNLDASGQYVFPVPAGILPLGLHLEGCSIVVDGTGVLIQRISPVVEINL